MILYSYEVDILQILSGSTNHSYFFSLGGWWIFCRHSIKGSKRWSNFFKSHPCPSLPSVATDDRQQFQCLSIVLRNETGSLFAEFNDGKMVLAL